MKPEQELEIGVRATLTNAKEIQDILTKGIEKGLVSLSDKDTEAMAQRIKSLEALLNEGLFKQARKGAEELTTLLLRVFNTIHTEAGGASNDLADLLLKLKQAEKALGQHNKRATELVFRDNTPKRGALSNEQQMKVQTTLGLKDNWNAATGVKVGKEKLEQELSVEEREKVVEALKLLGYEVVEGNLKLIEGLREAYDKQFQTTKQKLQADVDKAQTEYDEELKNTETSTVSADGASFNDAEVLSRITTAVKALEDAVKSYSDAVEKEREEEKKADDEKERAIEETTKHTKATQQNSNAVTKAVTTFFGYQMVIRQLRRLWREAIHTITELDKQLTNQAIVTGMTRQETWQLINTYQELADATGLAQTTIAGVTTEYLRQGESLQNALVLTKAAAAAATVAGISAQDSVKYLTTAIHGFKLEAEDALAVSDKFAALAVDAATNYEDLAIALSKVASQAALAGMSMDYTLALLTAGLDVTQEAPESIGTALKTVIARMREISDYGKTLEDGIDINQVEDGLHAVNIELRNGEGELRSTEAVLDELGRKWETLTANQQAAVAKALAGTRQQSRLVAIMENYNKVLEYQETAANSIGATTAQQVTYLTGLEAATNRLQNAYQSLIEQIVHSDEIIGVVSFVTRLIKQVTKFLSQPMGRWALFSTIAALMLRSEQFVAKMRQGFNDMLAALNKIANKQREITAEEQKQAALNKKNVNSKIGITQVLNAALSPGKGWLENVKSTWGAMRNSKANQEVFNRNNLIFNPKLIQELNKQGKKQLDISKKITNEDLKQWYEEKKSTSEDYKQLQATKNQPSNGGTDGGKVNTEGKANLGAKISTYAAIATTAISWATEIIDIVKNATKEAAQEQLEKATEIQSQIYNNTQTISSIKKLSESFDKLDKKVVKTAEDMQALSDVRTQLLEVLGLDEQSARGISTSILRDRALAKQADLEAKNLELVSNFTKELMGESGFKIDWGSAMTNLAMKAGTGALLGTSVAAGPYAAVGAAIGAGIGAVTAIIEETIKAAQSNDSKRKITEMLKTDEGVQQFQTVFNYNYKADQRMDEETETAVRSSYANLVSLLNGEQIESLLKQYDYNIESVTTHIRDALGDTGDSVKVLNNEFSNVSEKTEAVAKIYERLSQESKELADAFSKSYEPYIQLGAYLTDSTRLIDEFGWSVGSVGELINELVAEGIKPKTAFEELANALNDPVDPVKALTEATKEWSATAVEAAIDMITSGRSMQDIADQETAAINKVRSMRETQAKWGSMSPSERRAYMDDNAEFFRIPGAREAFLSGADITEFIGQYRKTLQDSLREDLQNQRYAAYLRLNALNEKAAKATGKEAKALNDEIADLTNNIADLEEEINNVDHMFDLSLADIVSKQNDQISKLKEMYQAEEKALTDSLNKRKEAYQKYFDSIASQEAAADYEQNRNQLIESISRLSGGTDAISRNKVADLRKQLDQIEKEEARRKTEEARQAVLQNIDDQVAVIEEKFDKLLNNNQELLASMDENTEAQYLNYLATLNLTGEDLQLRTQELSDLLQGIWTREGRKDFNNVSVTTTPTPQSPTTEQDPQSVMNLSIGNQTEKVTLKQSDMQELLKQMFTWLNANAGTHFIV